MLHPCEASPIDLNHRVLWLTLLLTAALIPAVMLLVLLLERSSDIALTAGLCMAGLMLLCDGTVLAVSLLTPRVTFSAESIVCQPRKGPREEYSLSNYHHLYTLRGYRSSWLLFSSTPLDREAQRDFFRQCRPPFSRYRPLMDGEGLLLLDPMLSETEILRCLPPHIRVAPRSECTSL